MKSVAIVAAVATFATACALMAAACLPAAHIGLPLTWSG
jgi:hypothetical protein